MHQPARVQSCQGPLIRMVPANAALVIVKDWKCLTRMMISVGRVKTSVSTSGSTQTLNSCKAGSIDLQIQVMKLQCLSVRAPTDSDCCFAGTCETLFTPLLLHVMHPNKLAGGQRELTCTRGTARAKRLPCKGLIMVGSSS